MLSWKLKNNFLISSADVLLSDSECTRSDLGVYWKMKPTQITFSSYEKALDSYCISGTAAGKYNEGLWEE